jgi:RNA polymerase sigma factor (sigma-70 family)
MEPVSPEPTFDDLLRRIRGRDAEAATQLVRRYESAIRRAARIRLADPALRRVIDSVDICQLVLKSFFVRAALGEYPGLESADDLVKLLVRMAHNKVADQARRERARRPRGGELQTASAVMDDLAAVGDSPVDQAALRELLERFRASLSDEERQLADLRLQGRGWDEIAAEQNGSPEALRKKLERAVQRVLRQLDP